MSRTKLFLDFDMHDTKHHFSPLLKYYYHKRDHLDLAESLGFKEKNCIWRDYVLMYSSKTLVNIFTWAFVFPTKFPTKI